MDQPPVNPGSFGPRFTRPPLTKPAAVYGGTHVSQTGVARSGVGATDPAAQPAIIPSTFPWGATALGFFAMAIGGALTGYLATGGRGWKGPATGALTHIALFSLGTSLAGRNTLTTGEMISFGGAGLAAGAGAGWLFWGQRKGGRSRPTHTLRSLGHGDGDDD